MEIPASTRSCHAQVTEVPSASFGWMVADSDGADVPRPDESPQVGFGPETRCAVAIWPSNAIPEVQLLASDLILFAPVECDLPQGLGAERKPG